MNENNNKNNMTEEPSRLHRSDENLPSVNDILAFVEETGHPVSKNDVARRFKINGNARIGLKRRIAEMIERGQLQSGKGRTVFVSAGLPPIAFIIVGDMDKNGEITGRPEKWPLNEGDKGKPPVIFVVPDKKGKIDFGPGDRLMAKMKKINASEYEARPIKKMELKTGGGDNDDFIAFCSVRRDEIMLHPTDKRIRQSYKVRKENAKDAGHGDLVTARPVGGSTAEVIEVLGHQNDPNIISLISIHSLGIPTKFAAQTIAETEPMDIPELGKREDLRGVPLVTIDGEDSRDFDDAVFAEPDTSPDNPGGRHLIVAIADVSFYVRPGSSLDNDAYERGNSCYFPDRVVPMLPERLSNELCSLVPHEPRACMAAHLWIDAQGNLIRKKITRALMKSHARLTYNQVERALNGVTDDITAPLLKPVIKNLHDTFKILLDARKKRGALDLDIPERKVVIENGKIVSISPRERLCSHMLIEEFMVLANVAVAEALEEKKAPCIYRIHPTPDAARLMSTRSFLKEMGFSLEGGNSTKPGHLNDLLTKTSTTPQAPLIHEMVLRSQSQANYSPGNVGHFGLALEKYAHFTSPIRRYADLVVHRSLVSAFGLGVGGLTDEENERLEITAKHISDTERRAVMAERDSLARYVASFMSDKLGATFKGMITGVNNFGLFVRLDDTGAEGIVPIRTLPRDYYVHDETRHALIGKDSGRIYRLCAPLIVRLVEANGQTGGLVLEVVGNFGADLLEAGQVKGTVPSDGRDGGFRRHGKKPFNGGRPGKPGGKLKRPKLPHDKHKRGKKPRY